MELGSRQHLADEGYLGKRRAIEMANTPCPKRPQHARLGVAFDGIKNITREAGEKTPRADAAIAAGRRHNNGSAGRVQATTVSTDGNVARPDGREE